MLASQNALPKGAALWHLLSLMMKAQEAYGKQLLPAGSAGWGGWWWVIGWEVVVPRKGTEFLVAPFPLFGNYTACSAVREGFLGTGQSAQAGKWVAYVLQSNTQWACDYTSAHSGIAVYYCRMQRIITVCGNGPRDHLCPFSLGTWPCGEIHNEAWGRWLASQGQSSRCQQVDDRYVNRR